MLTPSFTTKSNIDIPSIGLGTYQLNNPVSIISQSIDIGYRHFDTAKVYGTENAVGDAIRNSSIDRSEFFITSKLWSTDHHRVADAFQESLDKLQLDYLDLYLIHAPRTFRTGVELFPKTCDGDMDCVDDVAMSDIWHKLLELKDNGLVREVGVSNFGPLQLENLREETGVYPAVNQIEVNPFYQNKNTLNFCKANGILVEAYSPLCRKRTPELMRNGTLTEIASNHGTTVSQVVLRWLHEKGIVSLPKSSSVERLSSNISINFRLTKQEVEKINILDGNVPINTPLWCKMH
ncbi:hypothetical protein P9112_004095 [Eukaryota sp. TZLM1-RC]